MEKEDKEKKIMKRKRYHQTGGTTPWLDLMLPAKVPGWRTSKRGHRYYEGRKNRSDMPGKKL